MRREMHGYIQTRLADFSDFRTAEDVELTNMGALKTLLSEVLVMSRGQREIRRELREVRDRLRLGGSHFSDSGIPSAGLSSVPPLGGQSGPKGFRVKASAEAGSRILKIRPRTPVLASLSETTKAAPQSHQQDSADSVSHSGRTTDLGVTAPSPRNTSKSSVSQTLAQLPAHSADLGVDGAGRGWEVAGTVLAAVLSGEVAGMVSSLCERAAEITGSVATSPLFLCSPQPDSLSSHVSSDSDRGDGVTGVLEVLSAGSTGFPASAASASCTGRLCRSSSEDAQPVCPNFYPFSLQAASPRDRLLPNTTQRRTATGGPAAQARLILRSPEVQ